MKHCSFLSTACAHVCLPMLCWTSALLPLSEVYQRCKPGSSHGRSCLGQTSQRPLCLESCVQAFCVYTHVHIRHICSVPAGFCFQAAADQAWQQERSKLQTALQAAQQRLHDLERVNAQLQVHLETHAREAAGQAPDEGTHAISYGSIVAKCCGSQYPGSLSGTYAFLHLCTCKGSHYMHGSLYMLFVGGKSLPAACCLSCLAENIYICKYMYIYMYIICI